jgi:transposase
MYIERVPNRNSPPAILLRESYREDGRVRKRTLANLSKLPPEAIAGLQTLLKGGTAVAELAETFTITRSLPHGHVAAVLGTARRIGLPALIALESSRERDLVLAMIVARMIDPGSKLATVRGFHPETCTSTLAEQLGVSQADEDDLYTAMDWLIERQADIENRLAQKHLSEGTLVLYDVSSTYFEGHSCPLVQFGYSRDRKRGKAQIVFGLLCNPEGCPVAVEVFAGNQADPTTLPGQIAKVRQRFGIHHVVWVADRGLLTEARIRDNLREVDGLDWISALTHTQIRGLVEQDDLQLSLFDQQDLVELTSEAYPGERLMACRNPLLAEARAEKREALLQATEAELDKIVAATQRDMRPLRGADKIGVRVGKVLNRFKVAKHFTFDITENNFSYQREQSQIDAEAALDGIDIIRTSVPAETLSADATVKAYKSLSTVEQAFRSLKTMDLKIRPIHHRLEDRVKTHVFLCMLAYYVEWHMRQALAPILVDDDQPEAAQQQRSSAVAPAKRAEVAQAKAQKKRTSDGEPVHSFQTLLADLATIAKNHIQSHLPQGRVAFEKLTRPTPLQQKALNLLGVRL